MISGILRTRDTEETTSSVLLQEALLGETRALLRKLSALWVSLFESVAWKERKEANEQKSV